MGIRLVFDYNLRGFAKWLVRVRRLHGLAEILIPPTAFTYDDMLLLSYTRRIGAKLVTSDQWIIRGYPEYRCDVIILRLIDEKGKSKRYEELATELASAIRDIRLCSEGSRRGDEKATWHA